MFQTEPRTSGSLPRRLRGYFIPGLLLMAVMAVFLRPGNAQQLTGTLSGTVYDQSGAVIPNAKIELKNAASGDMRHAVSDKVGFFSITAVQPASYTITVSAKGFASWQENDIVMAQGDDRQVANIKLRVGDSTSKMEVVEGADAVVPVDTAEISTTINTEMINDLPIGGRDAGELMKIMPGFGLNNGLSQGSSFNPQAVGSNNGPVGAYSSNGTQPNGTMAFMLDGANLVDPGNFGTQIANINQDMTAEIKVLTSSYSAEYAKGPVLFEAFSKSGGSRFHGEAYLYARNSALNSWDSYSKNQYRTDLASGAAAPGLAQSFFPDQKYYYMGGNIGGPVLIPFTHFNKDHNKLFFWVGYEYMYQHPAATPINYNVPDAAQLSGDFTNNDIDAATLQGIQNNGNISYAYNSPYNLPGGGKKISPSLFDPNLKGLMAEGAYPASNITRNAGNAYNNYTYVSAIPQNRWEGTGKIDYAFSESTKLTGSYTRQDETDQHPISIWWQAPWTLPYPSGVVAPTVGNFIMTNFTHVFNPTTTNEFVFTYARWINPSSLTDPAKVDRSSVGFNVKTVFDHGATISQIPNVEGPWGGALPNISNYPFQTGFDGNSFGGTKLSYATYDNFTKVIGSHSIKVGAYWDFAGDNQTSTSAEQGTYNVGWGSNGTGNAVADLLLGRIGSYAEQSSIPTYQIGFHQWSLYAQDSWKANRQLTINAGLRADHEGQWYGGLATGGFWFGAGGSKNDIGFQVWDPSKYVNAVPSAAPANTGLTYHAIDSSDPLSGFKTKFLTFNPRVGLAYDIFGNGKTVFRTGFAVFQYQITSQIGSAWNGPQGSFGASFNSPDVNPVAGGPDLGYAGIANLVPPGGSTQNGSSVYGIEKGDNRNPYTRDWNVTVSQALKWRSVFEISYIGNKSANLYQDGSNGQIGNLNNTQPGAIFRPDPYPTSSTFGKQLSPAPPSCNTAPVQFTYADGSTAQVPSQLSFYCQNLATDHPGAYYGPIGNGAGSVTTSTNNNGFDYAPLLAYQNVYQLAHSGYSAYNSLQMSWQKQSGPVTFLTNYTFSKVLGIWDYNTSNGSGSGPDVDVFNLRNNYGPLEYDHTHILNLSYIWNMGKFVHGNPIVGGVVNGWQFSGYTALQAGAPIQPGSNGNLNATYASGLSTPIVAQPDIPDNTILLPNGLRATSVTPATWYGTPSQRVIVPTVTCNPTAHLAKGQYFNPNCFTTPAYGALGTLELPYMRGPAYFDSDLALFKNFNIKETQKFQLRIQATNFLNHPLKQFQTGGVDDLNLNFQKTQILSIDGNTKTQVNSISPTNTNTTTTGKPLLTVGSRNVLLSAKYYF